MKQKFVTVLAIVALALGMSGTALAQSAPPVPEVTDLEKVVAYTQPSVVYLDIVWTGWVFDKYNKTYLNDGDPFYIFSSCTGFFVNSDGHLATAGHCVDKNNITPDFFDQAAAWALEDRYYASNQLTYEDIRGFADEDYRLEGLEEGASGGNYTPGADLEVQAVWSTESTEELYDNSGNLNGETHDARVVKLIPWDNGEGDTAILQVETSDPVVPLPLADAEGVTTGTSVTSIGYPASVGDVSDTALSDPSFKEGSVSSVRSNATYPVYEMSASMSGGMSGGPTVDNQGQVVGVNSFSIVDEVSEFKFVQGVETLNELMIDAGVESELGEIGTAYRAGLDAYFAGNKQKAVQNLTTAAVGDDLPMADEYLVQAQALPDPPPPSEFPVLPIGLGVGVLLLGGIAAFLVIRKRESNPQPAGPEIEDALPVPPVPEADADDAITERMPGVTPIHKPLEVRSGQTITYDLFCTKCGHENADEYGAFCGKCGTPRNPRVVEAEHRGI